MLSTKYFRIHFYLSIILKSNVLFIYFILKILEIFYHMISNLFLVLIVIIQCIFKKILNLLHLKNDIIKLSLLFFKNSANQ